MKTSLRILVGLSRVAAVLAVATTVGGCVAAKHYDEARSVAESEMAGHARTRERLANALARLDGLQKQLADKELALSQSQKEREAGESVVAASKLETTVAVTEKRAAAELVDQLRAELARTGDHLRAYAGEKRTIEQALLAAEERLRNADVATKGLTEMVGVVRDLAIGFRSQLASGDVSLSARNGALVIGAEPQTLFAPEQSTLSADSEPFVATVAKVAAAHPSYRVELRGTSRDAIGDARLESFRNALIGKGTPVDRVAIASRPVEPTAPAPASDAAAPQPAIPSANPDGADATVEEAPLPTAPAPSADVFEVVFTTCS
jgi:flagellar motor protein MotB